MSKLLWQVIKTAPAVLGISFLTAQGAMAMTEAEKTAQGEFLANSTLLAQATEATASPEEALGVIRARENYKRFNDATTSEPMSQVTSVSELRDVEPTAWAYEALRSLVERYGCIVGYPDRTFRGDRALTRWEFAAGLNACLNVMERLIQENVGVLKEDVDKLRRLAEEFQAELAALGARVDNLESRVSFLEDHQFSTTTKLNATAIFAVTDASGALALDKREEDQIITQNPADPVFPERIADEVALSNRVRINLDTSFTGSDRLRTRLTAGNVPRYDRGGLSSVSNQPALGAGTDSARLGFDEDSGNEVFVEDLYYRFRLGTFTGYVGTVGLDLDDIFNVANPFLESSDTGALSRFSRRNPLTLRGPEGAGFGAKYKFSPGDSFYVTGLYLADNAADPSEGNGLFNGSFSAGAQIGYEADTVDINFIYLHSYFSESPNYTGTTGSRLGRNPFDGSDRGSRDSYGIQATWQAADWLNIAGWGAYALATAEDITQFGTGNTVGADYWTWNVAFSFLDVLKEGAVFNVSGGLLTRAARVDQVETGDLVNQDQNAGYIVEVAYQYPITNNIQLTPGAYVLLNPDFNSSNPSVWVGVLRTTFSF